LAWSLPRAFRFGLHVPVCFRARGQQDWRQGQTENMSRSGVLFSSDQTLKPQDDVEMLFVLPVASGDEGAVVLSCQGRVVRAVESETPAPPFRMAATFLRYQFLRPALAEEA